MTIETEAGLIRCCGPKGCGTYGERDEQGVSERMCEGRGCMGWRWEMVPNPDYQPNVMYVGREGAPSHLKSKTDGYCGLAGRP